MVRAPVLFLYHSPGPLIFGWLLWVTRWLSVEAGAHFFFHVEKERETICIAMKQIITVPFSFWNHGTHLK